MSSRTKTISYNHRVHFFWTLVTISILSLFIYIYAISSTARNIASREKLEKQVTDILSSLDSLEFAYLELKNNVTIELAYHYGFREVRNPLYIPRTRPASLSLNTISR